MCDCIKKLSAAKLQDDKAKESYVIDHVVEVDDLMSFDTHEVWENITYTTVKVRNDGQMRPLRKKKVYHLFCPFCGACYERG